MAKSLTASVQVNAKATYTNSNNLDTPTASPLINPTNSFVDGSAANQAHLLHYSQRTLTGTSETIDLTATLTDAFGATMDFSTAAVKAVVIQVVTATAGYKLTIGNAAATAWTAPFGSATDKVVVGPGSTLILMNAVDGFVVDSTHKSLKIDAGANTVTYNLYVIG